MKAYICEMCKAQLNPNDTKDGILTCPYCGQIYSMKDEVNYAHINKPSGSDYYDYGDGEKAFKHLFGV